MHDNCYAVLSKNYSKVGKIYDISIDGLAFRYLGRGKAEELFSHVDIFLVNNGFYLNNLPCKIIYEAEDESFGKGFITQIFRCGLQFLEPTNSHTEKLIIFIQNFSKGTVA